MESTSGRKYEYPSFLHIDDHGSPMQDPNTEELDVLRMDSLWCVQYMYAARHSWNQCFQVICVQHFICKDNEQAKILQDCTLCDHFEMEDTSER